MYSIIERCYVLLLACVICYQVDPVDILAGPIILYNIHAVPGLHPHHSAGTPHRPGITSYYTFRLAWTLILKERNLCKWPAKNADIYQESAGQGWGSQSLVLKWCRTQSRLCQFFNCLNSTNISRYKATWNLCYIFR